MAKNRIAIIDGLRTPFCRAGGQLKDTEPDDLGAYALAELVARYPTILSEVQQVIMGNVLQPPLLANISRICAVKGGIPISVPAYTVNRNCASGLESIASAYDQIRLGEARCMLAGGTESMSNYPVLIKKPYREFLQRLSKAKGIRQQLETLISFRPSFFLPEIPEISDPLCGLTMGQTAENLVKEFKITRESQDVFALNSQTRAAEAMRNGSFAQEILPIPQAPRMNKIIEQDEGPRSNQTLEALQKLKPVFEKYTGTVTAGNSSQVTDGGAACIIMEEKLADALSLKPLGYIIAHTSSGLQPSRMGLGPAFAISKILKLTNTTLSDYDRIEINEAFAAQVLACIHALDSDSFAKKELGRDKAVGLIDQDKLNVNGGAIALGHPLGASGTRLVITILKELKRQKLHRGLVALCIGGGQGEAMILEAAHD